MADAKRRLAAILSADVAGYSRLMGQDDQATLEALKSVRATMTRHIESHEGRVVNAPGDALLAEFPSALEAVRAAVDIQGALGELSAGLAEDRKMLLRIGINLGDVLVEPDGTLYGDGVNIAARLEALAEPGGICVSGNVVEFVGERLDVRFAFTGEHDVKNIAKPVLSYRVELDNVSTTAAPAVGARQRGRHRRLGLWLGTVVITLAIAGIAAWQVIDYMKSEPEPVESTEAALPDRPSIAVLPFTNMSDDPEQEYFSDGISEEIITALSRFPNLLVIARNSTFTYKGRAVKVKQVGQELGVRYVLEGSVRKAAERVRVTAQLIDASTGYHVWAETYEEEAKDIFALQDAITQSVVGKLVPKLDDAERARAFAKPTEDLEAYDYVLRGREFLFRTKRADNLKAREMFAAAIARDPGYAAAYTGLSYTHMQDFWFGWAVFPARSLQKGKDLAERAINLAEWEATAHVLLANIYLNGRQYERAGDMLDRVLELNPNDSALHGTKGMVLLWSGRAGEGVRALETALRLDPNLPPMELMNLGLAYYLKERYDDSIRVLERSLNRNPDFLNSHIVLAAAYAQAGRDRDAANAAQAVGRLNPFFRIETYGSLFRNPADKEEVAVGLKKAGLE